MDKFTKEVRSAMMSRVKTSGTDIEKLLIEIVRPFWKVERYRKNVKSLPGKPDILFPRSKIAVFADGDFWHGKKFKKWGPKVPIFWRKKITGNILRDRQQSQTLKKAGYRVLRFYGSDIKKKPKFIRSLIARNIG